MAARIFKAGFSTLERAAIENKALASAGPKKKMNLFTALNDAMRIALKTDETCIVFGEDVAFGGVFRCSVDLRDEFGAHRVFNTPLSEQVNNTCCEFRLIILRVLLVLLLAMQHRVEQQLLKCSSLTIFSLLLIRLHFFDIIICVTLRRL